MFALVTSETFILLVNTLTPDDKYFRRNMQTFWQQFQTSLSHTGKTFCNSLLNFWNVHEIYNILKKKNIILA